MIPCLRPVLAQASCLHIYWYLQEVTLGVGEGKDLCITFDPEYKQDKHIRIVDETLRITYKQHPHVVSTAAIHYVWVQRLLPNVRYTPCLCV